MRTNLKNENVHKILSQYLQKNEKAFIDKWEEQIIVNINEDDKELIRKNGYLMYQLIINSIMNEVTEDNLKLLADKVALERSDANINIGDFVYNVNLGRSIIVKYVNNSGIELEELQPIVDLINRQFDLFCYYAVTRYTELNNMKLQEKNSYIAQTHKERLAILGQMSSSFVHEFRNPLTSVMGFIKILNNNYPELPYLDIISKELEHLKFRITQFLHTSKMNTVAESKIEDITVKHILEEVIDFLYPSIVDGNILVNFNIDENIIINGDRNELKQVFLNLLMNAIDAVGEEEKKRKIIINTEVEDDQIGIFISNNGSILNTDSLELIFEPFYTTKKLGTGIGLFVCKNIIEKHNGKINCTTSNDLTTFQIRLPIINKYFTIRNTF